MFALIGNFGTWEIILILFVALLVFGPGKLPEVAKTIGKTMGDIRRYTSGIQKEFQEAINLEDDTDAGKKPAVKTKVTDAVDAEDAANETEEAVVEAVEDQEAAVVEASEDREAATGAVAETIEPVAENEESSTAEEEKNDADTGAS
ncbi:MAG: Sec-independent protein translocase TatA [Syntrophomonadaceae bacterium]|nr:Sec-independent protein translocase TatA [Syntrophomonadaceae bacterium]